MKITFSDSRGLKKNLKTEPERESEREREAKQNLIPF